MKAMILAAGRGERMRPLTDETPKPLLSVAGKSLIEHQIEKLVAAGFADLVINVSWLGDQIIERLGQGERWGCQIRYSPEPEALETAGGIIQALPLLGAEPFALVNGDIWSDYPLEKLHRVELAAEACAHLVMIDNPPQHAGGDFLLDEERRLRQAGESASATLTYSGMAVMRPDCFHGASAGKQALRPWLDEWISRSAVTGEHYSGNWTDVGTPERLAELDARLGMP
jgi:MurNAc alpha-1-phosphate uridylyltransferase